MMSETTDVVDIMGNLSVEEQLTDAAKTDVTAPQTVGVKEAARATSLPPPSALPSLGTPVASLSGSIPGLSAPSPLPNLGLAGGLSAPLVAPAAVTLGGTVQLGTPLAAVSSASNHSTPRNTPPPVGIRNSPSPSTLPSTNTPPPAVNPVPQAAKPPLDAPPAASSTRSYNLTSRSLGSSYVPPPGLGTPGAASQVAPPPPGLPPQTPVSIFTPPSSATQPVDSTASFQAVVPPGMPPTQPGIPSMQPGMPPATGPLTAPDPMMMQRPAGDSSVGVDFNTLPEMTPEGHQGQSGWLGWIRGDFMQKVAEKAKTSVEKVITTLDPQMSGVINTGGEVNIVVASSKEVKISPVREAFQRVFGMATVSGLASQPTTVAAQPVGYAAGVQGASEREQNLRLSNQLHPHQPIIAVENFLAELLPEQWFDLGVVLLRDPARSLELKAFTQAVPVDSSLVAQATERTPQSYDRRWSGLSVTVGQMIAERYPGVPHDDWHQQLCGVSRRDTVYSAALSVAYMYQLATRQPVH